MPEIEDGLRESVICCIGSKIGAIQQLRTMIDIAHKLGLLNSVGTDNPNAKLTDEEVLFIYNNTINTHEELMKLFDIGRTAIRYIKSGKPWKHLTQ